MEKERSVEQDGILPPMRSLRALALRNLAARRLRTLFTGVAITLGVAAVFATSLLSKSAQARTAELARQGSRADLQITPREGGTFDARVLDAVRAHPDVALASPEIRHNTIILIYNTCLSSHLQQIIDVKHHTY